MQEIIVYFLVAFAVAFLIKKYVIPSNRKLVTFVGKVF
jgi:hypothetical protein